MTVAEMMKDTFSPHELAIMAGPPTLVMAACGALLAGGGVRLLGLMLVLFSFVWIGFFGSLARCPTYGKSPWHYQPFSAPRFPFRPRWRLWPEHECLACRTPLDGI